MKKVVKEAVYHRGGYWIVPEKEFESLRQAIAEAEKQEPIGVVYKTKDICCGVIESPTKVEDGQPLYTHPQPKR